MNRVDSHHHFWKYSAEQYSWINDQMSVLRRDFGPDDLRAAAEPVGVNSLVTVQARQTIGETEDLLALADQQDMIAAVVGWVPLQNPKVMDDILRLNLCEKLKAVRHVVQDEPDDAFILGQAFNDGVARLKDVGLAYDILIYGKHLENSIQFVDRHPDQIFVLDHIAKPTIFASEFDAQWAVGIRKLAKRENVSCKFSGVSNEVRDSEWSVDSIRPYWDVVLEAFGPSRLMYGSDWPVCLLTSEYDRWVRSVEVLVAELSGGEQEEFWSGAACRAYGFVL